MAGEYPIYISVLGITGAGKSSFIRTITGNESIQVGEQLHSCTHEVTEWTTTVDGKNVVLIDTPGFDDSDTGIRDIHIVRKIVNWLKRKRQPPLKLSGVIYLHKITDDRMTGTMKSNLNLFRAMFGEDFSPNVVLVSARWEVPNPSHVEKEKREQQLISQFWANTINEGATVARYDNKRVTAENIIRTIIQTNKPKEMKLQDEIKVPGVTLDQTTAGKTYYQDMTDRMGKFKAQLAEVKSVMAEAVKDGMDTLKRAYEAAADRILQAYNAISKALNQFLEGKFDL